MCASTNLRAWRLLLFLGIMAILVRSACAATFPNVTFNMEDITTVMVTNKFVEIFPYSTPFSTNSAVIINDRIRRNTGPLGTFTVTNLVPGCYKVQSSGNWTMTPFNICFTNQTGNLNAHDLITQVVTVVDANKKFVQQANGVLVSPTNFLTANIFAGLNVTFTTNSGGQITINAATNGVSINNAVIHNGSGVLVTPTNFFHANLLLGTNMVFVTNSLGQITVSSTGNGGTGNFYTNNVDIWLSTRTDSDGDGTIANPRRADTVSAFDNIMIAYAAQSNLTFRMHPGRYYTRGFCPDAPAGSKWQMGLNWRVIGSGIDQTILTLTNTIGGSVTDRKFYHVIGSDLSVDSSYSEVSDLTVDCNLNRLTTVGTTNVYKTIAAVKLNGSHTAIRRVKAINFGSDGIDIQTGGLNDDVFVMSAAATFPQYSPRASHTVIEDCIMMHPSPLTTTNIVEFIHTSGAMNVANDLMAFTTNVVIRNNFVDGRFPDGTLRPHSAGSKLWHALTLGSCELGIVEGNHVQNVDVAGCYQDSFRTRSVICRNNTFLDVDGGGLWTFIGTTGEPSAGLGVSNLTSSGTTATLTVDQVLHDLLPQIDIVQVSGADDSAFNGDFVVTGATDTTITYEMLSTPADSTPGGTMKWKVHRGVRDIVYTGNTTLLRHGDVTSYGVGMVGAFNRDDLPLFHNVMIANNVFAFSDGKPTNNPNTGSVGIYVRNAKNAIIKDNLINLYTNTPGLAQRENIYTRNNGTIVAYNNRAFDGTMIPAHDAFTNRFHDMLIAQDFRIRETNGGLEYLQFSAGVMASNVFYVWPTTNGASGNVLTIDGGHPAKLSWGSGSSGISLLDGFGTNLTLRASSASGQTNLILRALASQLGDMMSVVSAGGNIVMTVSTNGHLRVGTGSTTVNSISRFADYGDGIAFDSDITRFLFNTNEVANIGNTTGIAHLGDNAAFTLGAAGDANIRRLAAGAFNLSASNSTTGDGLLQLAKVRFVESQGENTQYVEFLATNMATTMVNFWPSTNAVAGQFLTSRQLSGITNIWYWTNAPSGGTSVLSGDYIANSGGIGTNALFYGQNFIAAGAGLVISNTSLIRFTNSQVAVTGLGIWTNSAVTAVPLMADAIAGTTTNLATIRLAGANMFMVNAAGKVLTVDGTAALPALGRIADPTDGIYLADGTIGFSKDAGSFGSVLASGANAGYTHTNDLASLAFGTASSTVLTATSGVWTASTSTTPATGWGKGSLTGTNVNVLGALNIRESEVGTPDAYLTLRLPSGVSISPFTTLLWTTNGAAGQALKTTGTQLYWDDAGGGAAPGIAATDGTGVQTTFTTSSATRTNLTVKGLIAQVSPLQTWINSSSVTLAQVNSNGTLALPLGSATAPSITRQGVANEGIALIDDITRFTFNGTAAVDISPTGFSHLSDGSFLSFGASGDVRLSRTNAGWMSLNQSASDSRGSLMLSNITVRGIMTNSGPVTYPSKSVTTSSGAPRGWVDGALGNFFKLTLTSSTNLAVTNLFEGPVMVIITNPSTFTVTWDGFRTNDWIGPAKQQPIQVSGGVSYWTFVKNGTETNGSVVHTGPPVLPFEIITFSATTMDLSFNKNPEQQFTCTGNIGNLSTSGSGSGIKNLSVKIIAGASDRTVASTNLWRWMTPSITNGIPANTAGILTLKSYSTLNSDVAAWWNPQVE